MSTPDPNDYIEEIRATEAFENQRTNRHSSWPNRQVENRVEPFCEPFFKAPFSVEPGSSVFTIGSCFARNVERYLAKLGFDIPTHRAVGAGNSVSVLNNYTAPSMLNEITWALDPQTPYDPNKYLYRVDSGKVIDLHLGGRWARPTDFATACERRAQIQKAYGELTKCKLLILTLGLAEAWYDTALGIYLNSPPLKAMIANEPDRFRLRVLRHSQIVESLQRLITLANARNSSGGINCILTVSPIPLGTTFRSNTDVIVANSYSKATLRSATEEVSLAFDNVAYFPSYESITLSDRQETWEDDLVHVRQNLIEINVSRMVSKYVQTDLSTISDPNVLAQLALAEISDRRFKQGLNFAERSLRAQPDNQRAIFAKLNALSKLGNKPAALEYAFALYGREGCQQLNLDHTTHDIRLLIARMLHKEGRNTEALTAITTCLEKSPNHMPSRITHGDIRLAMQEADAAENIYKSCFEITKRVGLPYYKLAQVEAHRRNFEQAVKLVDIAITINPKNREFQTLKEELQSKVTPQNAVLESHNG